MKEHVSKKSERAGESPLEDPVYRTFDILTDHLVKELDPKYWNQLLQLLEHYIPLELKRRGIIPDETLLPIVWNVKLQKRVLH